MAEEPTVLDYVKSKLKFWIKFLLNVITLGAAFPEQHAVTAREVEIIIPADEAAPLEVMVPPALPPPPRTRTAFPWRTLFAFFLGLLAQLTLNPHKGWAWGLVLYFFAGGWLLLANLRGEWRPALPAESEDHPQPATVRPPFVIAGLVFTGLAYVEFRGGLFNSLNVTLWFLALAFFMAAFWITTPGWLRRGWGRVLGWLSHPQINLTPWRLLLIGVALVAVYFRADLINQVPSQMNSDHAEKLLDVYDVEHGITRIFFPRNTGREAFQFYLIAETDRLLHTGISFLSMKIGAIAAGLLTLPFIYLIGLEIGNRWVGLWAMAFAGIAYWPNVIARLALRFTFYPFFAAPTLYFLIRGLRRRNQNDLLVAGLLLGLGLHSYTPIRILPVVVVAAVGLYMLHYLFQVRIKGYPSEEPGQEPFVKVGMQPGFLHVQQWAFNGLAVITLLAVVGFLPLLSFISTKVNRDLFFYRSLTRIGSAEQPLHGSPVNIFIQNTWNAMAMFGWDNGDVWTVSVPYHPALDTVSAALCYLGMGLLFYRYWIKRNWLDLFMLISIPMLMLPSILSLAFPNENPVLSRTSGAIIPVFVIIGVALESLLSTLRERMVGSGVSLPLSKAIVGGLAILLFLLAANDNYDLVFNKYRKNYELSSWNSSEMGAVYKDFATTIGTRDTFWLVGFDYWVDSRLISIVAGYPNRDCAILPPRLADTLAVPGAKLFILHPEATASLDTLKQLYPLGTVQEYQSKYPTKNFLMFFVPPSQ